MARYIKVTTIVDAEQATTPGDYGILGVLVSEDWILKLANGTNQTMNSTDFAAKYIATSGSAALTGSDWN